MSQRVRRLKDADLDSIREVVTAPGTSIQIRKDVMSRLLDEVEYMRYMGCMCEIYGKRGCHAHSAWMDLHR